MFTHAVAEDPGVSQSGPPAEPADVAAADVAAAVAQGAGEAGSLPALLLAPGRVGVLFSSSWCAAGRMLARTVADHAGEKHGMMSARIVVCDVEKFPHVADRFQIVSLPTFLLLDTGVEVSRLLGAFSAERMVELLESGSL